MAIQQVSPNVSEVLERVLDKGIVIDARVHVMVVGIDLVTIDARVVVASLETYFRYAGALNDDRRRPAGNGHRPPHDPRGPIAIRIVREAFDAWNGHDVARYSGLLSDGYVGETHRLATPLRGREAASQAMDTYFKALPDFHFTLESAIASGNDVLVSWVATGTPQDEHSGASLTTRPLRVAGCTVTRLRHRKIVHTWNYWDTPICGC
jgi:predicted ester cyclase